MARHRFGVSLIATILALSAVPAFATSSSFSFKVVRNAALPSACVPKAGGNVVIADAHGGAVQVMTVHFTGVATQYRLRFLRHPGAYRAVWHVVVSGRRRDR